jgi:hypothetical protein
MKFFRNLFAWPSTFAALILFSLIWFEVPGRVEGKFFPVIAEINISETQAASNVSLRILGSFVILRENCNFQRTDWKFQGTSSDTNVPVVYEDGTKDLSKGRHNFGPWLLMLTKKQFVSSTVGEAVHTCPWRPWSTITTFYPT